MNIEDLQNRVVAINKEMEQTKAIYAKLEGHLAETHHWISEMVKKNQEALLQSEADRLQNDAVMDDFQHETEEQVYGDAHE